MKKNYLQPKKDTRESFYKKAYTEQKGEKLVLYSYETPVCYVSNKTFILNNNIEEKLLFSNTTLRHIKEFLYQQLDIIDITKKDLKMTLSRVWELGK